ncbi:MAG: carboxylesterase family protein [Cyclobacteriaceae bacterium]|nr:carboxylesterase family protein [Cyclobacteriaceae bacterium]
MKKYACTFALAVLILLTGCKPNRDRIDIDPDYILTDKGPVSGVVSKQGVLVVKGIPYAKPPIGTRRWAPPQPMDPWDTLRKGNRFGANAMQAKPVSRGVYTPEFLIPNDTVSEDCLYLNVWTTAMTTREKRPVFVWIHGGGFTEGSGSVPIYDGEALARKGIVVVTVNYRLGVFGFFAHPELSKESGQGASGNYGLMDQIAALRWVKDNIQVFGGDSSKVTLAGQSAGSMSVNALVVSPLAKGLFKQVIAQSGAMMVPSGMFGTNGLADAEKRGVETAKQFGATSVAELRKIPADTLFAKAKGPFMPIIDGAVVPAPAWEIYEKGQANPVNLLTGWNEDDWFLWGPVQSAKAFRESLEKDYGVKSIEMLKYYPARTDPEAEASQKALIRDRIFGMQNLAWANAASKDHDALVYVYRFARKLPAPDELKTYGAFHSGEIVYAFNNLSKLNRPWEPIDETLAKTVSTAWINFIREGNPNGLGMPPWPRYNEANGLMMRLDEDPKAMPIPGLEGLKLVMGR